MNRQHIQLKVKCIHSKFQALRYLEPATIQQFDNKVKRRLKFADNCVDLLPGQYHRNVLTPLGAHHAINVAEFPAQNVTGEKQQGIERLNLC